LKQIIFSIS